MDILRQTIVFAGSKRFYMVIEKQIFRRQETQRGNTIHHNIDNST